jgi:hypothetical protein
MQDEVPQEPERWLIPLYPAGPRIRGFHALLHDDAARDASQAPPDRAVGHLPPRRLDRQPGRRERTLATQQPQHQPRFDSDRSGSAQRSWCRRQRPQLLRRLGQTVDRPARPPACDRPGLPGRPGRARHASSSVDPLLSTPAQPERAGTASPSYLSAPDCLLRLRHTSPRPVIHRLG